MAAGRTKARLEREMLEERGREREIKRVDLCVLIPWLFAQTRKGRNDQPAGVPQPTSAFS